MGRQKTIIGMGYEHREVFQVKEELMNATDFYKAFDVT